MQISLQHRAFEIEVSYVQSDSINWILEDPRNCNIWKTDVISRVRQFTFRKSNISSLGSSKFLGNPLLFSVKQKEPRVQAKVSLDWFTGLLESNWQLESNWVSWCAFQWC